MGVRHKALGAAVAAAVAVGAGSGALAAELEVVVRGIAHDQGGLRVALYASPETFRKEKLALAVHTAPAVAGEMTVVFPDLAEGTYAVIAYHDENGNGDMDRFLGMIPTEGYGLSNNPEVSGPPQFTESAVAVGGPEPTRIVIDLRY
ncbi:MAG: DUF2141 domain-containing protein [Magnetospirillum sp.]|nr:DUF2141 domain-containing protein [Magnetospirillum sp.]